MTADVDVAVTGMTHASHVITQPGRLPVPVQPGSSRADSVGRRIRGGLLVALTDIHASNRSLVAGLLDLVALAAAGYAFGDLTPQLAVLCALAVVVCGYLGALYGDRDTVQTRGVLWYPSVALLPVLLVSFAGAAFGVLDHGAAMLLVPVAGLALFVVRLVAWLTLAVCRRRGHALVRTVVVGSGRLVETVVRKLHEFPEGGLVPVAVVPLETLSTSRLLELVVDGHRAQHVVLVPAHSDDIDLVADLQRNRGLSARFSIVPPMGDLFLHPGRVNELGGVPFIPLGRVLRTRTSFPGKRVFDIAVASTLLLLFSPLLAAAALAVKLDDRGPVMFRQRRVGKGGQTFGMLKFRSMIVGADKMRAEMSSLNVTDGLLFRVSEDPRITRVGRILRRLSVDELPQLWNVLRGEMSLVGPRPLPVDPDAFSQGDAERHTVLPGITGYWQISGGNGLTYQEMVTLDLAYIRNWSLWLDLRLMLRTLPALVHRHDPA
jgi:exopolysaccharide biosynthesis polyprenyl glycosylphosphotransferase